jgi:predicted ATPase
MRSDLPSGTVTFLFTDVEGSTRLLHELGAEGYAEALAEHRRVIREACAGEDGVEVDTQGDAFFFAFPTAPGALGAASTFTQALATGPIRVRVGLHTGTPHLAGGSYVGPDVNRAARIAGAGHGGQVLVSASTAALAGSEELLDLGEHRLKDLSAPERIYQLGADDFPRLGALHATNLPVPLTPFLGREKELVDVGLLLRRRDVRLLTLTGPGGTGKTRLAAQAAGWSADDYPDGVWWVSLDTLRDPELVLDTARQALGTKRELLAHIGTKRTLILFDCFERVVAGANSIAGLLGACPNLKALVTSRERLRISGEHEYVVPPLVHEEAVGFFAARARAARHDFEMDDDVSEVCHRLDDLPLALELAAARVKMLSTRQLLERGLPLTSQGPRDAPDRQRTLLATIEWSYELLGRDEQRAFRRLSVFAGGCTLDSAEEVAEADIDTLESLVDKSLLRRRDERYRMLGTIREYALEKLEASAEADETWERLGRELLALAEAEGAPMFFDRQEAAFARLEPEHPNTRAVMQWALEKRRNVLVAELFGALMEVWRAHGHQREAASWIDPAVRACEELSDELAVVVLSSTAEVAQATGDVARAEALYEEALTRDAASEEVDAFWRAAILVEVSMITFGQGDSHRARALAEQSLELRVARDLPRARALAWLGEMLLREGNCAAAQQFLEAALSADEPRHAANDAGYREALGEVMRRRGNEDRAEELFRDALRSAVMLGSHATAADCLEDLALVEEARGNTRRTARLWSTGQALRAVVGAAPSRPRAIGELPELDQTERIEAPLEVVVSHALAEPDA